MTETSPWRSVARMADAAVCAALADLAERIGVFLAARAVRQLGQGMAEQPADVETAIDRVARERGVEPGRLRAVVEQRIEQRRPGARTGSEVINLAPGPLWRLLHVIEPSSVNRRVDLADAVTDTVNALNRDRTALLAACAVEVLGHPRYAAVAARDVIRIVEEAAS